MPALPVVPTASVIESGRSLRAPLRESVDVVIIGSGAGGGMVAREVSRAGLRVMVLEEGGNHTPASFTQREGDMLPRLFYDSGGRSTDDGGVLILSGRGIGGSTVHNTNLCKRAPDAILERWVSEHGARGWGPQDLDADYRAVEADLHVSALTEEDVNVNNAILRRGVEKLGWRGALLHHNRVGCQKSGFCELGCAYNAKENAAKILIPEALGNGARVYSDIRVTEIWTQGEKALGVRGHTLTNDGQPGELVTVQAKAVCLSASAIGSAALVRKSDIVDPHKLAGRSLRLHPGVAVAGRFRDRVDAWRGIPQSYECTEKLSFEPGAADRSWILTAFAHPGGFAALQPGFGAALTGAMRSYAQTAVVAAMLHDETEGEVRLGKAGRPLLRYQMTDDDARALWRGAHACGEILLAAGAQEVLVPLARPLVARTVAGLAPLLTHRYRPLDPLLTAVHPMGTLALGRDPSRSVVDPEGRHHRVANVYVVDGSLFPTSLGGPPQISIYTAGRKVARTVVADLRRGP